MLDLARTSAGEERPFAEVAEALGLGLPYRIRVSPDVGDVRFLHIGAACLEMIGVPAETVMADASAFANLIEPDDRAQLIAETLRVVAERKAFALEVRMLHPDGLPRWRRITAAPRWFSDGSSEWDGLVVDITESKRLSEALTEERRRLELAVELTRMGVFQWVREDPQSVHWSDHQYAIYGLPAGSPVAVPQIQAMVHPDDRADLEAASRAAWTSPAGGDFSAEYRIVRPDGQVRWILQHQRIDRSLPGMTCVHGATLDVTERRNAEEQRRLQMREIAHRGKNALAVLAAMVHQAGRDAASVEDLVSVLMSRIQAMARSQELAMAQDGRPLPLRILLGEALEMFDLARFDFDEGLEPLTVPGEAVIGLSLLLHELATNAVKYGALSASEGRVRLSCEPACAGRLVIGWRETGGPEVTSPQRQGFGTRLLAAALQGVGGQVEPVFAREGFRARIELPAAVRA